MRYTELSDEQNIFELPDPFTCPNSQSPVMCSKGMELVLSLFQRIGEITLANLDREQILVQLTQQLIKTGILRNIMIALVDTQTHQVEMVRSFDHDAEEALSVGAQGESYPVYWPDDMSMATEVERTGQMRIIEPFASYRKTNGNGTHPQEQAFIYLPIKRGNRVLAVLGTHCRLAEKERMLERIEMMVPLLDQVAIALMHEESSRQLAATRSYLIQADKMASLGELAAGVSHEINNPVGFVSSNLETLRDYLGVLKELIAVYQEMEQADPDAPLTQDVRRRIAEIRQRENVDFLLDDIDDLVRESTEGMSRIHEITQSMKRYVRRDDVERVPCDLRACVEETLCILRNELKYKCKVRKQFGDTPPVYGHPGQLKQVVMNLISNAVQAIVDEGEILIETESTERHVILRISDTGVGIPAEVLPRLFEPFFTTKPHGEGTGLGLSISHQIIEAHQGHIEVDSQVGKGTRSTIKLPRDPRTAGD